MIVMLAGCSVQVGDENIGKDVSAATDEDNGSFGTTSSGTAATYPMNRLYDPSNMYLNSQCITTGGKLGVMVSKCTASPSTCGYLYCIVN